MAHERKCIVDLKEYKYCPHCNKYNSAETWRTIFCSENCRGIYKVVERFKSNGISALEAQELLKEYDLSGMNDYHPFIKKDLDTIYAVKAYIEETVEPDNTIMINPDSVSKTRRSRKKATTEEIDE